MDRCIKGPSGDGPAYMRVCASLNKRVAVITVVAAVVLPSGSELGGLPLLLTLGLLSLFGAVLVARTLGHGEQHAA